MTRTKYLAAVISAAVLALTGCSSSSETPTSTETVTVEAAPESVYPEPSAPDSETVEEIFLAVLADQAYFSSIPEADLLELGHSICEALNTGSSFDQVLGAALESGVPPFEAGYMVGAAVGSFCPAYEDDMDDYLGGGSNA